MKTFPFSPLTVEVHRSDGVIVVEPWVSFNWEPAPNDIVPWISHRDDGFDNRVFKFQEIDDSLYGIFVGHTPEGTRVVARAYDPYDPVRMGLSQIPWPKSVLSDWMNGARSVSLFALVDVNGDVATMLLESASAYYLRYSAQWVLMPDIEAISDFDVVRVEDTALSIYDPLDQTGKTTNILSMPVVPEEDFRVQVRYSGTEEAEALKPLLSESITASGSILTIPVIATARDVPAAVNFATDHPEFRWYVERRSKALRLDDKFPW